MEANVFPIKPSEIKEMKKKVSLYLSEISWSPNTVQKTGLAMEEKQILDIFSSKFGKGEQSVSLLEELQKFSEDKEIMSEGSNKVVNTILFGLGFGWAVAKLYAKVSGLENIRSANRTDDKDLNDMQIAELTQKNQTEAAVAVFTAANYIVKELLKYKTLEVSERVTPKAFLPELALTRKEKTVQCVLFYYHSYVSMHEMVPDEISLVKVTIDYFTAVLNELDLYKRSLQHLGFFEGQSYQIEGTDFVFKGFDRSSEENIKVIEVNPISFDEIVGNRLIKLELKRMVLRLVTYDLKTKRNPVLDLNGLVRIFMGMGIPGTGKTLLIRAVATMLQEMCKELGIKYRFSPLNLDIISKYQGESAEKFLQWMNIMDDLSMIVFAPIDDAESVFAKRDGKESSEGSNSVLKVFLNKTEGSNAIYRGNNVMPFFTNNWEIMDLASISRVQKRTFINGAETVHDFLDQTYLYFSDVEKKAPGLVNFDSPLGYTYLMNQRMLTSYQDGIKEEDMIPKNEKLREHYHSLSKKYNPLKNPEFVAEFAFGITKLFPNMWAARDMRNVYSGVSDKLMDFDYPEDWVKDLSRFFKKSYDEKLKMLIELRNANMKGLSFERILVQELVKYADIAVTINNTAKEKAIKVRMEEISIHEEATKRLKVT